MPKLFFQKKAITLIILVVAVLCLGLLLSEASLNSLRKSRDVTAEIANFKKTYTKERFFQKAGDWRRVHEGDWGNWQNPVSWSGEAGFYACGASVRVEPRQGNGDDTAMNGIRFIVCNEQNWAQQQTKTIHEGLWGDWSNTVLCPTGSFISGLQFRYEDRMNGDNTALNGLRIRCDDPSARWQEVHPGIWGVWKSQVSFTSPKRLICGARSRFQPHIGNGDDTGMNGLEVELCVPSSEMELISIVYDWSKATTRSRDKRVKRQTVSNPTSVSQSTSYSFEFSEQETQRYETSESLMIGASITVGASAEVSFLGTGGSVSTEITGSIESTKTFTFGRETSKTVTENFSVPVVADPCTKTTVTASADIGETTLPFTMTFREKSTGRTQRRSGRLVSRGLGPITAQFSEEPIPGCRKK